MAEPFAEGFGSLWKVRNAIPRSSLREMKTCLQKDIHRVFVADLCTGTPNQKPTKWPSKAEYY